MTRRSILLIYHIVILAILLILLGVALLNSVTFPRLTGRGVASEDGILPSVSVLVPARNEEGVIGACVRSLTGQDYPRLEVIVLDDNSEDDTGKILQEIAGTLPKSSPSLRILSGSPLPKGWIGKNWACAQLAEAATGDYLLYVDADTTHRRSMVSELIGLAVERGAEFVSGVPRQLVPTFWEKIIVPMAPFLYFCYLPNRLIPRRNHESLSAANGQMILMSRRGYDLIDGHRGVRDQIVEDVVMARRAKRSGLRVELIRADRVSDCRMYRDLPEIIAGFTKNLYPGLGSNLPALILFVAQLLVLYILPWGFFFGSLLTGGEISDPMTYLPGIQGVIGLLMRGISDGSLGMSPLHAFLHPLSAATAMTIAIRSWRHYRSGRGGEWKGRRYDSQ